MTQSRGAIAGALPWSDAGGTSALAAEAVYCLVSAGTILFNKHALSTYQFPAPNVLLTVQFGIAVLLLKLLDFVGILHLEPMRLEIVKTWFPVNVIFVLMNATGEGRPGSASLLGVGLPEAGMGNYALEI
jgi:hypothetical protein